MGAMTHNDPLRVGRGLVSGGSDPAEHTVTSAGARERVTEKPAAHSKAPRPYLGVDGLQIDIMENHDEAEQD